MLQSLIVGVYAGSSGTGTGGNYSSSGTGTGGQDYGSSGTGTGGNYGSSGTGTGQGGQGGQGYGVAGMIPGTEANREKKADQGQYGVPQPASYCKPMVGAAHTWHAAVQVLWLLSCSVYAILLAAMLMLQDHCCRTDMPAHSI